ncbi:MAG TPA: DUF3303 family protein [Puia sp.]|nr:DUF3303 family protein [Puia sp.]
MKFMITWEVQSDKRHEVLKAFSHMTGEDDKKDAGEKITLIGRWHNAASGTGVAVCETDDAKALFAWSLNWNAVLNLKVEPVIDDEEAREIGKKKFS